MSEVVKISSASELERVASSSCSHVDSTGLRFLPYRRLSLFCPIGVGKSSEFGLSPFTELAAERESVSSSNSMLVSEGDDCKYGSRKKEV